MTKLEAAAKQFIAALNRLKEVLQMKTTDVVRDSAIQRFEFTLDLSWKMLKAYLQEKEGVNVTSPKECFREAYRQGMIQYDDAWLKLVDMRNETAHTYDAKKAEEIFSQLPSAVKLFDELVKFAA
jgi:nucleotidyltransferase substrate binding protein (TIGR01987 family)